MAEESNTLSIELFNNIEAEAYKQRAITYAIKQIKLEELAKAEAIEQAREEEARIAESIAKNLEDQQRALKNKKAYLDFLNKNKVTDSNILDFYIKNEGNIITIYKKIDSITMWGEGVTHTKPVKENPHDN